MITPTGRAIVLAALSAPLSLALATMLRPDLWIAGVLWGVAIGMLCVFDAVLAASLPRNAVTVSAPGSTPIAAGPLAAQTEIRFRGRAPSRADYALETNAILDGPAGALPAENVGGACAGETFLAPLRRGEGRIERAYVRWQGPMGLAWRQTVETIGKSIVVAPDLGAVQRHAERLFSRVLTHGLKPLRDRGDGSEFDALAEFAPGMDRRLVEWKQSARHAKLLAKEVRAERNHQIAFAIDTGRAMCQPLNGAPRLDWSINGALLLAYVGLKLGDRVSFFGFDARPNLSTGFVGGLRAFPHLIAQTAQLDYSVDETNYTLSLATLSEKLQRRSMVIIFTDFSDPISAELMVENVTRLTRRHMVVFVTFPDQELEALRDKSPVTGEDVSRAVIAHRLLKDRDIVLTRLKRLGVNIVSAPVNDLGPALVRTYDQLRRRERG